jgi:tetratricopeptide (TPR) repeat protein
MSSVIAKVNKDRSQISKRPPVRKAKRVSSPKPKAKRMAVASKPKKVAVVAKPKKTASVASKKARTQPKKAAPQKKTASKPALAKARPKPSAKASSAKRVVSRKSAARRPAATKARQEQPRPVVLSPGRIAAVKAFEQALKQFNLHEFESAKATLEDILERFGDEPDIAAPARTYLAICDHRLARAPSIPRNPDALYDQGVFEFNRGKIREAIEILEKALKAEPRADHVLYSLAIAYARHGDTAKAIDALRRSISIRPVQRSHARHDPDFASLRTNREFQRLTGFGFEPPE